MKFTSLGLSNDLLEASRAVLEGSKEYQDFFKSALKKFGVTSPAEFKSDEEKKKFFDYVDKNYKGKNEESEIDEAKPSKKFIKLGDDAQKKNLKSVDESSRDYYGQVDDLIAKHGEEKAFVYKSPKLNKIVKELQKLIKDEVKAGFKDSKKDGETVIKQLQKLEVMSYDGNIVMTNKQHSNFKFNGDTAFREEMAEIIMQDDILSYAIFGE